MTHDPRIDTALREAEDRLRAGDDSGFFADAFETLRSPQGWVPGVMIAAQTLLFLAGLWFAWRCWGAADVLVALKTGLLAAVLVLLSAIVKMAVLPLIETRRVLRALRVLEQALAAR